MIERIRAVIFDLDGTLVDSAPHISRLINDMLAERGVARRVAPEEARHYLTQGGHELVTALLADDGGDAVEDVADFRRRYVGCATPVDCLFAGVVEGIARLGDLGVRLAICSNKPQALCDKIVGDLGLADCFDAVVGSRAGVPLKPAPDLAAQALAQMAVPAAECVYVGDSEVDRRTASALDLPYLFVTYGYAEPGMIIGSDARFDRFDDVVRFLVDRSG
jgi:phosphoglycolate phosphatase